MSETKHTPGPWKVDPRIRFSGEGGRNAYVEVASVVKAIWCAKVQTFTDDDGEYAANANLISAAPELLSQLKSALACIEMVLGNMDAMRAAIAKAEGRP